MPHELATLTIVDALHAAQIPFVIVGSLSSNEWGIPRSTKDADFVIDLGGKSVLLLNSHLPTHFRLDSQLRFEGVTGTYCNLITIEGSAFTIELFRLTADPHDQARFQRRIAINVEGRTAWVPTPEDVIITKLRWIESAARTKDRDDVAGILAVQGDSLNLEYVYSWCDRHGTRAALDGIRREIPADL